MTCLCPLYGDLCLYLCSDQGSKLNPRIKSLRMNFFPLAICVKAFGTVLGQHIFSAGSQQLMALYSLITCACISFHWLGYEVQSVIYLQNISPYLSCSPFSDSHFNLYLNTSSLNISYLNILYFKARKCLILFLMW